MKKGKQPLIVIAGPTSSGKSDLAIRLARRFNGEIISADSRQVYRGMTLGTGKVTRAEQRTVRHWMLDVASPKRQYTVASWRTGARRAIRDIEKRGKIPIVCGGTGFWIDALTYDLHVPAVKPDPKLRSRLQKLPTEKLFVQLQKLDPVRAISVDRKNKRRLIRALEIVLKTGRPVPSVRPTTSVYRLLYLLLDPQPKVLHRRIEKRLDARLCAGMLAEARRLRRQGVSFKRLESFGLEYRWMARYLQDGITLREMRDELLRDSVGYAKRQLTWWRKNPDAVRITSAAQAERLVRQFFAQ